MLRSTSVNSADFGGATSARFTADASRPCRVPSAIGQPGVFYAGAPIGGLWKTTSGGVTWFQIFDQFQNVDSIGAVQVAPSDPNIVYVGTGDSVQGPSGDGMYKSTDAGKTFVHIGLEETTKINKIVVDPKDPNIVIVSTQGDATHNGRGIYRTTDGGKTWENTLRPENANGTRDVEYAFDKPNVIFATSQGLAADLAADGRLTQGPNGTALYKSTDEGKTWKKIDTLPPYTGRISVAIAMHTDGKRIYVIGNPPQPGGSSGLYRSDDQGATWQHMAVGDTRIGNGQGGYSSGVWVDSQNPDILYVVTTYVTQSKDGGKTFNVFKGAPGGEDPHDIWIDPTNGDRMLFGFDQGPAVTLDGGQTWSGYYQIPIAQLYKVATDTRYPYWVHGLAAGHRRDHDAQPRRSGPDHESRLVAAGVIRIRHGRARPAKADDDLRRRLWPRTGQRHDQDRSRDRPVGQRRSELRHRQRPVCRRPRFLEALRHRVRTIGDVRRLQLHPRDARRRRDMERI